MKQRLTWRFLVYLVLPIALALVFVWPPRSKELVSYFGDRARGRDETFSAIFAKAQQLQKDRPDRAFGNLQEAIGTNDIIRYFPFFQAQNQPNPNTYILNRLQRESAGKIKLGLDLQGGTSFLVKMDTNRLVSVDTTTNSAGQPITVTNHIEVKGALEHAVEVLRKRVDKLGVAEPVIQPEGEDRILIQLPGLSEDDRAHAAINIQRAAFLEFRMVHEHSDLLMTRGEVPLGYEVLRRKQRMRNGQEQVEQVVVKKKPERGLTGSAIKSAQVVHDNMGQPEISFTLNTDGAQTFGEITKQNIGRRLAIVLDGELYSSPTIQGAIMTGSGQITGQFDEAEAQELAQVLENPLKAPLKLESSNEVDPTLGKDAVRSGMTASLIGILAVSVFMLIYYRLAGMVANIALITNVIILLGVMCAVGTTFTLPGIAGIVLTVGMAVDANVLIYERLREELAKGKSLRGAIAAGYDRAFATIFDSHVTTLISSVILIWLGTGSVKGFGVTLTIGVAASLFTALVVTRLIFDWLLELNWIKTLKMFHMIRTTSINFMRWALPAFIASWLLIAVGLGYGIKRGNGIFGVEFTGGDSITLGFDQTQNIDVDKLRESVAKTGAGEVLIGYQKDMGANKRTLRVTTRVHEEKATAEEATGTRIVEQFKTDFPQAKFTVLAVDKVGPTVGTEIRNTAILASLVAMFGILVYVAFRYEFVFAVAAVVAIIHDILMTIGCYFLSGRELNSTTVAAVLTIIGFSINDTIVIFDRIREDLKLGVRGSFRDIINQALNQTLSRTIITSGTVFLATMSLYIFGGGPVNDFAFTFLVGIVTGTYSSIYIASALVLWLHKGSRPNIGSQVQVQTSP